MASDRKRWEAIVSGREGGLRAALARGSLGLASLVYRLGRAGHRALYRCGLKRRVRLPRPVISVGNLTAGGVGKTPFVGWLAGTLAAEGCEVVVLARGYGRQPGERLNEEGRWLESKLPQVKVLQDPDRAREAVRHLEQAPGTEVFVLDDGFQHEPLERDLDIVLLDCTNAFGFGHLLPRGLMREPEEALERADFVFLTRVEQSSEQDLTLLEDRISRSAHRAVLGRVCFRIAGLRRGMGAEMLSPEQLRGRAVVVMCGVGNPAAVIRSVEDLGASIAGELLFADHHCFAACDLDRARDLCTRLQADLVITEKDEQKLKPLWKPGAPEPWILVQSVEVTQGAPQLLEAVRARIAVPGEASS